MEQPPETAAAQTGEGHGLHCFCRDRSQELRRRILQFRMQQKDMHCNAFDEIYRRSLAGEGSDCRCSAGRWRTCKATLWIGKFAGKVWEASEPLHEPPEGQPLKSSKVNCVQKKKTVQDLKGVRRSLLQMCALSRRRSLRRSSMQDMLVRSRKY